jgi:hypothetical protein
MTGEILIDEALKFVAASQLREAFEKERQESEERPPTPSGIR